MSCSGRRQRRSWSYAHDLARSARLVAQALDNPNQHLQQIRVIKTVYELKSIKSEKHITDLRKMLGTMMGKVDRQLKEMRK